jgi:hypothetical protein
MLAALCSAPIFAQQSIDPSNLVPITSPVIDLGTFNIAKNRWMSDSQADKLRANSLTVYNNTCTWLTTNYYSNNTGTCTVYFDEGRIPSTTSPNAPAGATDDNLINSFQFAYCALAATGTVDVKIGFYDNMGGCMANLGGVPYTGPLSTLAQGYADFGAAAGFPLPGNGFCYAVTIAMGNGTFCLKSDGDGIYDNTAALDVFNWSFESDSPPTGGGAASVGPVLAGEPAIVAGGGCTYNIPCGTDPSPLFGALTVCGHGLDTEDHWWTNHDGDQWGDTVNTGQTCAGSLPAGSTCYWFQGYPGNPFASFVMKLGSAGQCSGCTGNPTNYCTAGTTTNGCNATVSLNGVPSPRNLAPANIVVSGVEGQKTGLVFYGTTQFAQPWGTGTSFLCVKAPTQRTPAQPTGGTAGACNGTITQDINGFWAANPAALGQPIFAGQVLNFQGWFRDPPAPKTTSLSNALSVTICP